MRLLARIAIVLVVLGVVVGGDGQARAESPFGDPRLEGVGLADIDDPVARAVEATLALENPAELDEVVATSWVGGTPSLVIIDQVGRAPRFRSLDRRGRHGGLGVVRLEVPIAAAEGLSDVGPARVRWERAWADMRPVIDVSLSDQVAVLEDFGLGFRRVWPVGIGAADAVRRPGRLASLTPTTDGGRLERDQAHAALGGWNRGKPYLPLSLPGWYEQRDGSWRRWFYETRVAFHAWPGQTFIRGFVSRGCIVLRDHDLDELYAVSQALPADLALGIHAAARPDALHPLPHEEGVFWRLQDFGKPGKPAFRVAGNLYVIEKVTAEPPPDRRALVDIYSDGEARYAVALATARGCGPVPIGLRADHGDRCVPETALVTP
ncbi:MAG: L,D-transpeptidase [Deltaproteobacteria bacterium]|nr:L,D-transpeptidase [Deltaproteobacteria bacterium]